jgi:hypothetical protein
MRRLPARVLGPCPAVLLAVALGGCYGEDAKPRRPTERNPPSIGFIDAPAAQSVVGPRFVVAGWALDESGVDRVRVFLDDELIANAPLTVMRPDVEQAYKISFGVGRPHGFTFAVDAGTRKGYCTIRLEALDGRGAITQFATMNVRIEP